MRAYRYQLDPTDKQVKALNSHCGGANKAFNYGLGEVKRVLDINEKCEAYGLKKVSKSWSHIALRNDWNANKSTVAVDKSGREWWGDNSKWVYDSASADLSQALKNWSDSKSGKRKGKKVGFPAFRKKHDSRKSFRTMTVGLDGYRNITLPRIGNVRSHETTKALVRKVAAGGVVKSATVSRTPTGKWFVSILVDCPDRIRNERHTGGVVGIDLGLKRLATVVDPDGNVLHIEANSRHLKKALRQLRKAQRIAARRVGDRNTPYSNRKKKALAEVAKVHERVANCRKDQAHKFTNKMATRYEVSTIENLNVSGMMKNGRMARSIADAGWGETRRQLSYKCNTALIVDRFYPSSKTCSDCGSVKAKLNMDERTYECWDCGLIMDRDDNAGKNLAMVGFNSKITAVGYIVAGRMFCDTQKKPKAWTDSKTRFLREDGSPATPTQVRKKREVSATAVIGPGVERTGCGDAPVHGVLNFEQES